MINFKATEYAKIGFNWRGKLYYGWRARVLYTLGYVRYRIAKAFQK